MDYARIFEADKAGFGVKSELAQHRQPSEASLGCKQLIVVGPRTSVLRPSVLALIHFPIGFSCLSSPPLSNSLNDGLKRP